MTTNEQALQLIQQAQKHTLDPLNAIILGFVMQLPGSLDWKLQIYNGLSPYLTGLHISPFALIIIMIFWPIFAIIFILTFGYLLIHLPQLILPLIFRLLGRKKQEFVFLELTFPSDTTKSAYATEQLYRLVHTLGRQQSFLDSFAKNKKLYSLELVATRADGIRYIIQVPLKEKDLFKRSLLSYLPGIKIKEISDYFEKALSDASSIGVTDLKLAGHAALPLHNQKVLSEHDPIAYLTGHMTKLKKNELIAFQIVSTPVIEAVHGKLLGQMNNLRRKMYKGEPLTSSLNQGIFKTIVSLPVISLVWFFIKLFLQFSIFLVRFILEMMIFIISAGNNTTAAALLIAQGQQNIERQELLNPYEQELQTIVKEKIDQHLFESSVRILVAGEDGEDLQARMSGLLGAFGQMASTYQGLHSKSSILSNGMKHNVRFKQFQKRILSPNRIFNQNPILSTSELSDLYHFPYGSKTKTEDMVKIHSRELPSPLSLKQEKELDVVFGTNTYGGEDTAIGLTDDERSRHVYMIGQTGSGKSTIMFHMAKDDIQKGRGLAVVDPHGDLAEDILATIPQKRIDDFIYFNPFDIKHPVGINLLELTPNLDEDELELEKELVAEGVVSIFRRVFSNDETTNAHRIEYILRNAIYTAFTIEKRTIFTVYELLNNPDFQKKVVKDLEDENLKSFWKNEFDKAGNYQIVKMISGVTAKVGRFLFSPTAKRILEQERSTINFDEILNQGKILLCNLSEGKLGEDTSQLLGTTIITKIHQAALRRSRNNPKDRKPFYLFVDEFQNFATTTFTKLLSGGRKFGLRVTIAEQSTAQQKERNIVDVILANTGTVICFRTASPVDEELLLPQFSPYVEKGELALLPRYRFYIKLGAIEPEEPFSGQTLPISTKRDQAAIDTLIEESRKRYAITYVKKEKPKVVAVKPSSKKEEIKKTTKKIQTRSGAPV